MNSKTIIASDSECVPLLGLADVDGDDYCFQDCENDRATGELCSVRNLKFSDFS